MNTSLMKYSKRFLFLCQCSLLVSICFAQSLTAESPVYRQWHKVTLSFTGPGSSETAAYNPFTDYRLDVTFSGPSGQVYQVPGFFAADGNAAHTGAERGNQWQVRFCPDEAGDWTYNVSFRKGSKIAVKYKDGASGGYFDGQAGSLNVLPSDIKPEGRDFRGKGKLEYTGGHYLQFKGNKEYFLKGGANSPEVFLGYSEFDATPSDRLYQAHIKDWRAGDPVWKPERGKGIIGLVNYLSSLDNNVLYFLTMNREGDGKQVWPWRTEEDFWRYDCSKLDQWEIVFEHMDRMGLMMHFVLTETENESLFEALENKITGGFAYSRKLYYREMVARFGHHMAITWNIGEENGWADYSGDDGVKKANTTWQRKVFADYLRSLLYYNDPIVVHNGPSQDYHIYEKLDDNILDSVSYTGPSLQGDFLAGTVHRDVLKFRNLSKSEASAHKWVVTMDEPYINSQGGAIDIWRKDNVWATLMAGGAGIEFYLGGGLDVRQENLREFEDYYRTTATALNFFRKNVPFHELEPDDAFLDNAWTLKKDGVFYLIYFMNGGSGGVNLPEGSYTLTWFDPRNNKIQSGTSMTITGGSVQSLGSPPDNPEEDWACLVKRN